MEFIILRKEKRTYHIENADTPLEAVKQYVSYYFSGDIKPFTVLCNNGEMNLKELVAEEFAGYTPVVCANLPYNITTPILTALVEAD